MAQINSTTVTKSTLQAKADGYYALDYLDKRIVFCKWVKGITDSIRTLVGFDTWEEVQAYATANQLTGLPESDPKPAS
jgi:hypothetical protein